MPDEQRAQRFIGKDHDRLQRFLAVNARLTDGELLTIKTIAEVFGADVVYPLIYADAFYKPTVGMLVRCQKCGHEWAYDKCKACPFCLSAWKAKNLQPPSSVVSMLPTLKLPTLNPVPCATCDRPEICRIVATGTRPCDPRERCLNCGHARTAHQAGQCSAGTAFAASPMCQCRQWVPTS